MEDNCICNHDVNSKDTSIFVDKKKWYGVNPMAYKGVCRCCGENFDFVKGEGLLVDRK